jgi:hypothetical protein
VEIDMKQSSVSFTYRIPFGNPRGELLMCLALGIAAAFGRYSFTGILEGDLFRDFMVGFALVSLFLGLAWLMNLRGDGVKIAVNDSDLLIGWRRLPRDQVHDVTRVQQDEMIWSEIVYRVRGNRIGMTRRVVSRSSPAPVMLCQKSKSRIRWWLIDVGDYRAFERALRSDSNSI